MQAAAAVNAKPFSGTLPLVIDTSAWARHRNPATVCAAALSAMRELGARRRLPAVDYVLEFESVRLAG